MEAKEMVYREFTELVARAGFQRRRKKVWWEREMGHIWQRIHLHKFSFMDSFRVHGAIHVVSAEDEAPWLNGPNSNDGYFIQTGIFWPKKTLSFDFFR